MTVDINEKLNEIIKLVEKSKSLKEDILNVSKDILDCLQNGGKIIAMGNGGSAADSQHFIAEFVGRFKLERNAISAVSLTTDTSIITAIGNDYDFDSIFSRQCEALVKPEDVIIAISTSGNSKNIVKALEESQGKVAKIIGITGQNDGDMESYCDRMLKVPSNETPHIQEIHRIILHLICEIVEQSIVENSK
jgi:D-sedoheptulose 7-phosphate isomerase